MPRLTGLGLFAFGLLILSCSTAAWRSVLVEPLPDDSIQAASFDRSGNRLWLVTRDGRSCKLLRIDVASHEPKEVMALPLCFDRLTVLSDETLLLTTVTEDGSLWLDTDLKTIEVPEGQVVTAVSRQAYVYRSATGLKSSAIPMVLPAGLREPRMMPGSEAILGIQESPSGEAIVRVGADNEVTNLTGFAQRIDSYAVSPDEKELVFSAFRNGSFDVGLASTGRSETRWIGPDPANETTVSWAPRGNKVSYFISSSTGSLVRTVHVPTGYQLTVDLPWSLAKALAWEPRAEKFAVVYATPLRSDGVDLLRYGGEDRETLVQSPTQIAGEVAGLGEGNGVIIPPSTVRYEGKQPLIVWFAEGNSLQLNQGIAAIRHRHDVGIVITRPPLANLTAGFWNSIEGLVWVDRERIVLVQPGGSAVEDRIAFPFAGVHVVSPQKRGPEPDSGVEWQERGGRNGSRWVSVRPADAAVVESFAAYWISDRLEGMKTKE